MCLEWVPLPWQRTYIQTIIWKNVKHPVSHVLGMQIIHVHVHIHIHVHVHPGITQCITMLFCSKYWS